LKTEHGKSAKKETKLDLGFRDLGSARGRCPDQIGGELEPDRHQATFQRDVNNSFRFAGFHRTCAPPPGEI
jgi:hypothetical protein